MTLAHAGFSLERDYPHPVADVWAAFADPDRKRDWFGAGHLAGEWVFDFRVGGRDVAESVFHGDRVSRYVAVYTDIVDQERIVTSYDMWIDGVHISTSVASFEFEAIDGGTRLTHGEHGIHLDGFDDGTLREQGSRALLEALADALAARTA